MTEPVLFTSKVPFGPRSTRDQRETPLATPMARMPPETETVPVEVLAGLARARMRSPETGVPVASVKITRSASPSKEMPRSAPCWRTRLPAVSG